MVKTVGLTENTPDRLLLDAGAIYKNLKKEGTSFTGTQLGATSGGNEFQVEIETRQPELDGVKTRIKGLKFVNSHEAQLVVNLKELTAENIKNAIGPADVETDGDYDKITGRSTIKMDDYLENIAYVGRLSNNNKPVVIILKNALSAEGFTMSSEDNNEATIPITFHAHAEYEDIESGKVAYEIYWPKQQEEENEEDSGEEEETGGE